MSQQTRVAVLSTSCRFPDANSSAELWTNVIHGRRSFRAIPKKRLDTSRYLVDIIGEADSITPIRAGLLTDWQVDCDRFRIPKMTFAATDHTHWLALELATEAIASIGGVDRLDRSKTAVIVANTLTGEFSRTSLLRLRAPFLDELLAAAVDRVTMPAELGDKLRGAFVAELRRRLPDPNEESLAGGLANTIAGRIANYFDMHGGAYSVDGACASSMVALADAATLLVSGQIDAAVVAAVDLSLDPFELVGFSRAGALAVDEMRVFDARANGFWPGEGGACAVLMREQDAARRGFDVLANIRGWGLSTDGTGGLTRPSVDGQQTAYRRAYQMADVDPNDVAFVEAHGTGTAVGDPIEVRALAALREGAHRSLPIGSIKANIGHTKAAAGFAGLIKTIEALRHGFVPPHVSCDTAHPVFAQVDHRVHPNTACEPIGNGRYAFAGVSSFGFGGINAHLVLEHKGTAASRGVSPRPSVTQDAELFLFAGNHIDEVLASIAAIELRAPSLSMAEFADMAAYVASKAKQGVVRAAVVASQGEELAHRLARIKAAIASGDSLKDYDDGIFTGQSSRAPRVGFLFPGQGAPSRPGGGAWRRRFAEDLSELTGRLTLIPGDDLSDTRVAQPCIVAASLASLRLLDRLGFSACVSAGHSLGEISALAWAGALTPDAALGLAIERGSIMSTLGIPGGSMLRVALSSHDASLLAQDTGAVVACRNGAAEVVLSGDADAITAAAARCRARGIDATRLSVSHAFHSPHMATASPAFAVALGNTQLNALTDRTVVSTVSGAALTPQSDIRRSLLDQLTQPVLFDAALELLTAKTDILVEVGPGHSLTRLARTAGAEAYSVDAFADSLKPLLSTAAALFAAGAAIRTDWLFEGRHIRAIEPSVIPRFIESPCGSWSVAETASSAAPLPGPKLAKIEHPAAELPTIEPPLDDLTDRTPLAVVLSVLARETGLRAERIGADDRFLDTLHLNSLAVTRVVVAASRMMRLRIPATPTEFANATARQVADALAEIQALGNDSREQTQRIAGVRPWVRAYAMSWAQAAARSSDDPDASWSRLILSEPRQGSLGGGYGNALSIWIDGEFSPEAASDLIDIAADAARLRVQHLALCHRGAPISGFARSIARERHFESVRVIDCANFGMDDLCVNAALSRPVKGFDEVRLTIDGQLLEPIFAPIERCPAPDASCGIGTDDVVVVVGGGKGIAAECALQIGRRGAAIILVGRSPASDIQVAATLERAHRSGLRCHYVCADVLDSHTFSAGLNRVLAVTGPATTLVYAPAINEPRRLTDLDQETVLRTLAPKTSGLQSTLQTLGPSLRRLITFGSIIGRIGLEGESHYALANAMQTAASEAWAAAAPARTSLAIEWSVWAGVGMGERLGTVERLSAQGVDALSLDDALAALDRMIATDLKGTLAVTGRFGPPPELSLGSTELPTLRFVDNPLVAFPGTELVIETTLSGGRDLYLDDHAVDGHAVLPAVMGLEAMAQVASALAPIGPRIIVCDTEFCRVLQVPSNGATRIRIAALRHENASIDCILFAADDDFSAPCMRASFSSGKPGAILATDCPAGEAPFTADPLYGPLFFHGSRFQRLKHFEIATSRRVIAQVAQTPTSRWFGAYEATTLKLGDPAATDAALHALQVAVPHRRVLPVRAARIEIDTGASQISRVSAFEKRAIGHVYTFDILASDSGGRVAQRWTDISFRAVDQTDIGKVLSVSPDLIAPYLERAAREALDDDTIAVAFVLDPQATREQRRNAAVARLGLTGKLERRSDGRPIRTEDEGTVSIAHVADATLAIAARSQIGCDIEASGTASADLEMIRRHVTYEACRKVGRKPMPRVFGPQIAGAASRIEDVQVITIEIPLASKLLVVAFGRLDPLSRPAVQRFNLQPNEVTS
ncbi:SDR family NAD(P)-dependent oxidoreductase [Bradyrhizobium sp. HKCCYLS1011]|uniref:SDR family NAD(P)-dependent oxidoreductase n=1 Tax=Bradyrhizobium sp. HKCCYLS1011 TaxID=3420733 RepID=UPI003EBE1B33